MGRDDDTIPIYDKTSSLRTFYNSEMTEFVFVDTGYFGSIPLYMMLLKNEFIKILLKNRKSVEYNRHYANAKDDHYSLVRYIDKPSPSIDGGFYWNDTHSLLPLIPLSEDKDIFQEGMDGPIYKVIITNEKPPTVLRL
jgi:hypothetical protein